jgi:hypothetical protein
MCAVYCAQIEDRVRSVIDRLIASDCRWCKPQNVANASTVAFGE